MVQGRPQEEHGIQWHINMCLGAMMVFGKLFQHSGRPENLRVVGIPYAIRVEGIG